MEDHYHSLVLSIYGSTGGYALELSHIDPRSQAQTATLRRTAAIDAAAFFALELDPVEYGRALARQLFAEPEVKQRFMQVEAAAQSSGNFLRLALCIDPSAAALQALRWELLRHPSTDGVLATSERMLLSRFMVSRDFRPLRRRTSGDDLCALIAVSAPPGEKMARLGLAQVDFAIEAARIQAALGHIQVQTLGGPGAPLTVDRLMAELRGGVDILYLVSHGRFGTTTGRDVLILQNESDEPVVVQGEELAARIGELQHGPRLVVLASCQSAGTGSSLDPTQRTTAQATLAGRLADAGVPAVLAMQGSISIATIEKMMPVFFAELLRDGQIDRALAVARGAVRKQPDFWMPVLYSRLVDGRLWLAERAPGGNIAAQYRGGLSSAAIDAPTAQAMGPAAATPLPTVSHDPRPRVFISCRGDDAHGLHVATALHEAFAAAGASPFLSPRSIVHREPWITAVSAALRECDAFVVLLSPQGAVSEMVAAELDMARQLAARGLGRPYILPVRIHLPESADELHPLHERLADHEHAQWQTDADIPHLVSRLLLQIGHPHPPQAATTAQAVTIGAAPTALLAPPAAAVACTETRMPLELPGGIVPPGSPYYVTRPLLDEACRREVLRPGTLIRIKGPRQMGKTSLMMTLAGHAAQTGARIVNINLQMADAAMLTDQNRFLRWLCAVATRRLKLAARPLDEQWDDIFSAKDNCTAYFEERLLGQGSALMVMIDHVDRLFEAPVTAEETLTLLRAWHEMGKCGPPWDALRLVLVYSTEMYLPLQINHSPFNVGLPAVLGEWDGDTIHDLAQRHGLSWGRSEVERLMALIGGHPHLVRITLYHVAGGASLDAVLASAATDEGLFADHLRYLLWHVEGHKELREAAARVMKASEPVRLGTEVAFKLVSLGLGQLQGNAVRPARELYRRYFDERL